MICEHCKKRNECKVAEAYIAMKDIIRITECDEYEEDKKTNKIISYIGVGLTIRYARYVKIIRGIKG